MRNKLWGACLLAAVAAGVYLMIGGAGRTSHCGPCVSQAAAEPAPSPTVETPPPPAVVEVVDVKAVLQTPAEPNRLPFVSFEEPPLARPAAPAPAPASVPDVIQTSFTEPAPAVEVAPRPRPADGRVSLASVNDPY